ncbi:hypothetical protein G6F68_009969 [Rhizopus microsporus]|nr:hypothetical protein G6F68_009969 [Rhizopus microsporus]
MIVDIPETSAIPPPRLPGRRPSGAYRLAIQAAHHHGCRPRIAAARPHRVPVLVGMLDVDEERGQVRRVGDAGDFATQRPHQETLGLARLLVDVVHRVIAEDIGDVRAGAGIGLHPQAPLRVHADAVRAGELVALDVAGDVRCRAVRRVLASQEQQFPFERGGQRRIAALFPAHDVAVAVGHARIGGAGAAAAAVVGQRAIDRLVHAHRDPLGAVHQRRARHPGSRLGVDEHVGLAVEVDQRIGCSCPPPVPPSCRCHPR